MDHSKILGTVLAGGKSVRLGMDKSQVKLADKLLIDYILSEIIEEFKEILIVANKSIDFQKSNKISVIEDFKKDLGPLGGVFTAMKWIKDNNKDYQWVSTFPTDSPFFKNKILKDFFNEIHPEESKLFFIKSNNTRHNIFGLWSLELMNKLEEDLNKGERKVEVWANSVGVKVINMDFEKDDPFFNINTKEDLEKAKAKIGND
ncbi:MAG: molybdenum cofactor guanylyltransferase [Candidatus Pelagibacter bacterium]|jgi:molybdopterin-guanine dinucleotide biosynthesis protein A|nr:molybdenum cofactor guanylyltransferase [Candidatus Pelagibacter bacterium]MBL6862616.1 molybdenum cofactor guanylyltransferase [Candidatus Pelagibacter bacterium]MDF1857582.1 molybdenum cofactor guanylyltransferase [Candidatus Pelagibacter bacterium]